MTSRRVEQDVKGWNRWFRAVILASATAIVLGSAVAGYLSEHLEIPVATIDGLQTVDLAPLDPPLKLAVFAVAMLPDVCWLVGLAALWRASAFFARGEVLAVPVMRQLSIFGWALVGAAAATMPLELLVGALLHRAGRLAPPVYQLEIGDALQLAVGGVLVIVLAVIFRRAAELDEDARLTV